jgi:transposase-like protein
MTKKQQQHTKEFKLETIELARTSGKNDSQLERE